MECQGKQSMEARKMTNDITAYQFSDGSSIDNTLEALVSAMENASKIITNLQGRLQMLENAEAELRAQLIDTQLELEMLILRTDQAGGLGGK